jgi:hypothetical protein
LRRKQPHSLTQGADRALYAKLATASFLRALRQVVDSTVGDVVQLVRTLPRHWLESHTVTAASLPCFTRHPYIKDTFRISKCVTRQRRLRRSPYNGLANSRFHTLLFGINTLHSDTMPPLCAKSHCLGAFVQPLCNQNFNGLSRQCPTRRPEGGCPAS